MLRIATISRKSIVTNGLYSETEKIDGIIELLVVYRKKNFMNFTNLLIVKMLSCFRDRPKHLHKLFLINSIQINDEALWERHRIKVSKFSIQ